MPVSEHRKAAPPLQVSGQPTIKGTCWPACAPPYSHCMYLLNFRKDFNFHRVGGSSGVNKPIMRGITPLFKKPLPRVDSCTPQSGLTSVTRPTTRGVEFRSLSDQTMRSKPFMSSSRLSLPHSAKPPQEPSVQGNSVSPGREAMPFKPCSLTNSMDDAQHMVTSGGSVQKSSPPVAFVAPVVSKPTITRSVTKGLSLPGDHRIALN